MRNRDIHWSSGVVGKDDIDSSPLAKGVSAIFTRLIIPIAVLMLISLTNVAAAPSAEPIAYWSKFNDQNLQVVDHSLWNTLLKKFVVVDHPSGVHLFRYSAVGKPDRAILDEYLAALRGIDPRSLSRAEQQAYWINIYNALTVDLILDNYPVKSITKISDSFFGFGPWDDEIITLQGKALTLNDIEHGILRPIWKDPRIHYAVNCASMSCPNLLNQAFTSANTDRLLNEGGKAYVNHPRGVSFDGGELRVSSIYHWYRVDFGGSDSSLISHLQGFAEPALKDKLGAYQGDISHDYDWNLNQP